VSPSRHTRLSTNAKKPFDIAFLRDYLRGPFSNHHKPPFTMPTTEVILTEKIDTLGAEADIVKVRAGYARNFLIPHGKAIEKTKAALHRINILKAKRAEREARELNEAQELARRLNKMKLEFELESGETGKAFGSVTASDIADKIRVELGGTTEIDRHRIVLPKAIKDSGKHEVEVKLHHDVTAVVNVNITTKSAAAEAAKAAEEARESGKPAGEKPAGGYKAKAKAKHKEKE
jgi:large subunit ribosomal protein L9